jgi:GNAT acetyltransferase-like protein
MSTARLRLRPLRREDAPVVAELHAKAFGGQGWPSVEARAAYFREVLFDGPWCDAELPSWIAEDGDRMVGFLAVLPRPMRAGGRRLRAAVSCQFAVHPDARSSLVALALMKRFISGPQDLSIADGANDASCQCWLACGGIASALHRLHWLRLLRPGRALMEFAASRPRLPWLKHLLAPAQAFAHLLGPRAARPRATESGPLEAGDLVAAMQEVAHAFAVGPCYEARDAAWLLGQARAKRRHGELQGASVRAAGRLLGWFLYYLSEGTSRVLSIGGSREALPAVLDALFAHARERGAAAIEGRVEPQIAAALRGKRCLFYDSGISTLMHAREPALLLPFLSGDAQFTRLEGEWWMRFSGGTPAPAEALCWRQAWRRHAGRRPVPTTLGEG